MKERFFNVWAEYVIGNKEDFKIGLAQLEEEIRQDERKKVLEWLCHHSTDYDLIDEHGMHVDSEDMQYGWNCKQYEAKTIDNVLTEYEKWLKGEQT